MGRANTHGVAVSLVSTVPEKVWYVQHAKVKPWENPTQSNTADISDGGHTTWLHETKLLNSIHGMLPGAVNSIVVDQETADAPGGLLPPPAVAVMGTTMHASDRAVLSDAQVRRLDAAKGLVEQVLTLEAGVQHSYFAMLQRAEALGGAF